MAEHVTEHRSFDTPDEVREFPHGRAEILNVGGAEVGRLVLPAGLALVGRRQADRRHGQL